MELRRVCTREQRHDGERLAGIDRAENDAHLVCVGELRGAIHCLGRFALGVANDQLDLPSIDAAGGVDLLHGELDTPIDPDPGG